MDKELRFQYTDAAQDRLEKLKLDFIGQLEGVIEERKYVPGDNLIEVTASDLEIASKLIRVSSTKKLEILPLTLFAYMLLGLAMAVVGIFYSELESIFTKDPQRGVLVIGGFILLALSAIGLFWVRREHRWKLKPRLEGDNTLQSELIIGNELQKVENKLDDLERNQKIATLLSDAAFHMQNGNYGLAVWVFDKLTEMIPGSSRPYLGKARVFKLTRDLEAAVQMATEAVNKRDEYQYASYYNRACYKTLAGNYAKEDILNDLKYAISLRPEYRIFAAQDKDFGALHDDPDFVKVLNTKTRIQIG